MEHMMRGGVSIKISDMDDRHLINTINFIKRKAKEGLTCQYGGGGMFSDPWYDEETYYGKDAEEEMNLNSYIAEKNRRGLIA